MKQSIPFGALHEELVLAMSIGQTRGIVDTLIAIAEASGVSRVHGVSIRDHIYNGAVTHTETAIADIADDDPDMATVVKQRWDEMRAMNVRDQKGELPQFLQVGKHDPPNEAEWSARAVRS